MTPEARIAVVVPAHDEARLLPRVLEALPPWVWRALLVDDASRDRTWDVIREWNDPRAVRLRARRRLGVGGAILLGYRRALELGAAAAVVVAGDAQMDLAELPRVLAPLLDGEADYVQGVRFDRGVPRGPMPRLRVWGNRMLSACTSWAAGTPVGDSQCGYTAAGAGFLRQLVRSRLPHGYGFPAFVRLEAHRLGLRVREVPVRALYGSEVSGIHPWRDPALIAARLLWLGARRRAAPAPGRSEAVELRPTAPRPAGRPA